MTVMHCITQERKRRRKGEPGIGLHVLGPLSRVARTYLACRSLAFVDRRRGSCIVSGEKGKARGTLLPLLRSSGTDRGKSGT